MLIKILFTMVVIVAVIIFYRNKQSGTRNARVDAEVALETALETAHSISPRMLAYGLLGVLVGISLLLFALNYHAGNRVVAIRVISDGAITDYEARYKSIRGRNFVTTDGTRITLGESERIEMIAPR